MSVGFAKKNLNRNNYIFFSVIREKMAVSVCDWQACMMITVGGGGGGEEGGGEGGEDGVQPLAHHDLLPATAEASLPVLPGGAGGSHKLIAISRTTRDHHGLV